MTDATIAAALVAAVWLMSVAVLASLWLDARDDARADLTGLAEAVGVLPPDDAAEVVHARAELRLVAGPDDIEWGQR